MITNVKPTSVLVVDVADLKDAYLLDDQGWPIGRALAVITGDGNGRLLAKLLNGEYREVPLTSVAIDGLGRLWLIEPWQRVVAASSQSVRKAERTPQLVSIVKRS